jgi:D-psicose/D-tagatose/L-ribulose 3-epimerase
MKYGANALIWTANFTREHVPLLTEIKRHGFDGVEFPMFQPRDFALSDIRRGLEQNGLECTCCSAMPAGTSVFADEAPVRRTARTFLEDCIKMTAEAGGKIFAGPFYSPVGHLPGRRRTTEEWSRAVECYQSLGPVLAAYGVTLAIEPLNRFETYFLNTAADAVALCDETGHPNVGILFDTFHANIEEKEMGEACRAAAPHLKHVHTCENDRGIPGSGHVAWQSLFQALHDVHYDGWLTIESFGFSIREIAAAASIWRDLAPTPESIAFEGVKFLKRGMGDNGAPDRR